MKHPRNCKKCGGKMQAGGRPKQSDYPDYESWQNAADEWTVSNQPSFDLNFPQQPVIKEEDIIPGINAPLPEIAVPEYKNSMQEDIDKGVIDSPKGDMSSKQWYDYINTPPDKKRHPSTPKDWKQNLGIGLTGITTLLSEISGRVARGRQNQYDYNQQSALGMMNPMPTTDYQPNPYSLYAKYGGRLKDYQDGGSIVNYLASKNMDYSKEARKNLAKKMGIKDYDFSANKNTELLNLLKAQSTPTPRTDTPKRDINLKTVGSLTGKSLAKPENKLESGYVVDKRTGQSYIIKNGKPVKNIPVITGLNPELNSNPYTMEQLNKNPQLRNTPVGTYNMLPNQNLYGVPGFNTQSIAGFDMQPAVANGVAVHTMYDEKNRKKLINTNSPFASYGCVNLPSGEIKCLTDAFPKGDTMLVLDSKKPEHQRMLNSYNEKKYGGLQHVNYFGPPFSNGAKMDFTNGQRLDMRRVRRIVDDMLKMKDGGIHIKEENRGKFTDYCGGKVTEECIQEGLDSPSAKIRKRANFARNARKWNHKEGGLTPNKAREILHDGTANGKPLTDKQRRFFGAKSKGHTNYRGK